MDEAPLVDTHCHLDFDQYDGDRAAVLAECGEQMDAVINIGTAPEQNRESLALAAAHDVVHATMGLHPTYDAVFDADAVDAVAAQVAANKTDIVAVGEVGLDYHHVQDAARREQQAAVFRRMLQVAAEHGLPVVTHTRDAEQDAVDILQEDAPQQVVMHCFNGRPALAAECVDRGYHVAISTQVLYSDRVQAIADTVPLDHMLLETDAPFLWPDGRNVPWHVRESAEQIADIKDVDAADVAAATAANAADVFGL